MKYDGLIEAIDEHSGELQIIKYQKYYLCYNPFSDDNGSRSASIWRSDGTMQVHNSSRSDGKYESRYSLIEWIKQVGCVDLYVKWICKREGIVTTQMKQYEKIISKRFSSMTRREKGMLKQFKDIFHKKYFLTIKDVLDREKISGYKRSDSFKPKKKAIKTDVKVYDPMDKHVELIKNYMKYRGIPESSNVEMVTVEVNNFIKKAAVCFKYPNGFRKLRFIGYWDDKLGKYVDINKKFKFMANSDLGEYQELYEIRKNGSRTVIVCEGETEGFMVAKYIENSDVFTLHNAVAIADKSKVLNEYDRIFLFVDLDRYNDIKDGMKKALGERCSGEVRVLPKFNQAMHERICEALNVKNIDFNDLYIRNRKTLENIFEKYEKVFDL